MKNLDLLNLAKSAVILTLTLFSLNGRATTHVISVDDFMFSPSSINVTVGDTVKWNWVGGSHTTTSTSIPSGAAAWDSPMNSSNASFLYVVTKAGIYNYKCTPHAPNMAGSFTATGTSFTPELSRDTRKVIFYPNPANDFLNVELGSSKSKSVSVVLSDILGNPVYRYSADNNVQQGLKKRMDLKELPSGIYFLSVVDENSKQTFKILKNTN